VGILRAGLNFREDPAALLIPQPALMELQIGRQVFVVNADNKVESRSVEVGRGYQGQWVIKKGLKQGEKVIVEGTQKARPGMVVDAKPQAPNFVLRSIFMPSGITLGEGDSK